MIFKTFRIARMIVLAGLALTPASWAATCSNASLSGPYGFVHDGVDSTGAPATAALTQIWFDSTTGTFSGETTASHGGVIVTTSLTGTYTIASNCTGTGTPTGGIPFSIVVTSTGFLGVHTFAEGYAAKRGSATCTNEGIKGSFGFETTGNFLPGASATGWAAFIGELKFAVNSSGEGVITGRIAGNVDSTIFTFPEEPVTGSYNVAPDCSGRATITPKGQPEMHFNFVVVDSGNEMLTIETDPDTVVSGTLFKNN
jgi:hypothetical protein